ncbi:MAG: MBL fold metallo-hydrolase [Candidatus Aureabacteria bacterium]|nr:MBL fold metallo-hydrolase [Candidatus Auribacterota bacterium]NLW94024.1 MBL fold metallo-hydrolase [Chlamydiota bacterium]HOE28070.1 MBL fold metallo-hydrolase [bacterium]
MTPSPAPGAPAASASPGAPADSVSKDAAAPAPLRIHFIDVGHGDACLIQTPRGNQILIDGGSAEIADALVRYLREAGVKRLALLVATHPHSDHIGGLPAVLRAFDVETVFDSGKRHPTAAYRDYLEAVQSRPKARFTLARAGQSYRVDDVRIDVLNPGEPLPSDVNDCSVVCRLSYGDFSIMLAGDVGVEEERRILRQRRVPLGSTVLKVAHHGSTTSTSAPFLRAVAPKVALISCKERDSQQWAPKVVQPLKARGVRIYRTDHDGTIIIESDGNGYTVKTLGEGLDEAPMRR